MDKPPACPSGKRTYNTRAAALWALVLGKAKGTNTYRCRDCHRWHTTSHPTVIKTPRRRRA